MLKFLFSICLVVLLPITATAQPENIWRRFYDYERGRDVFFDIFAKADGGYAICGSAQIPGEGNPRYGIWLVVTNANGDVENQQVYVTNEEAYSEDRGYCLIELDDGGFAIGGIKTHENGLGNDFAVLRVNRELELLWWNRFSANEQLSGRCLSVIETKGGNILATGDGSPGGNPNRAYAVLIRLDGDIIWERHYQNYSLFYRVRELADVGYVFTGPPGFIRTNQNGEVVDADIFNNGPGRFRDFVSSIGGGYVAFGLPNAPRDSTVYVTRVDADFNHRWTTPYIFPSQYVGFMGVMLEEGNIARTSDGGYISCGFLMTSNQVFTPFIWRVDDAGNTMWCRIDRNVPEPGNQEWYTAVTVGRDQAPVVVGKSFTEEGGADGILVKVIPEVSAPEIIVFTPPDSVLHVLSGDSIFFAVLARDWQNDDLTYVWRRNGEVIGRDTSLYVKFDEIGVDTISCTVADDRLFDSVQWQVRVHDLYIFSYMPDSLNLVVQRGSSIDFSIDSVRYSQGEEPRYLWRIINPENPDESEEAGSEQSATITFPRAGRFTVEGMLYRGDSQVVVRWNITVRGLIWAWSPENLELSLLRNSSQQFRIFPLNPESDSTQIGWSFNNEVLPDDSNSTSIELRFEEPGEANVKAVLTEGVESDSLIWHIMVRELGVEPNTLPDGHDYSISVTPNPFNSLTEVRFSLPFRLNVSVSLYDISGREIETLLEEKVKPAGSYTLSLNGKDLPAGLYLVRLVAGSEVKTAKMVLMR